MHAHAQLATSIYTHAHRHCSDEETLEGRHRMFPLAKDLSCKYQSDVATGDSNYIDKPGKPVVIR